MFDEETVILDTQNETETTEAAQEVKEGEIAEERAARLEETNKRLYERAKKAEEIARSLKAAAKPLAEPKPAKDELAETVNWLKTSENKRQIGYKLGLAPEETDKLFKFAGDSNPEEAFKDPFFQAGLKEFRRERSVKEAIPSGSNRSTLVEGKSFADMTPEEREKNWGKIAKRQA